ncbi:lipocalin family protein [Maribacter confluentis]|uniref:Lipocalin family protein n=1 Tax=Maribacter confluentis TaxID=1656093 RepID=A0ABT8RKG1_9FLAO|nr:lipocalin family protein [Maribacter confluentis]MDO1511462.1 lipocalin family protein [Maribacter confluentis]
MKISISILLLFFLTCQKDDIFYDTPIDETGIVGEWLLKETYISPGGETDWKDVAEGHMYLFRSDGSFQKTATATTPGQTGDYEINENELMLYVNNDTAKDTLGFNANFNDVKTILTLSPTYPNMCIEGCYYRYKKQ